MNDQLIVGIDGSPQSATALRWAAAEAVRVGASLHLVHAVNIVTTADAFGTMMVVPEVADFERYGQDLLNAAEQQAHAWAPEVTVTSEIKPGIPAGVLVEGAEDARGIVVGSRGLGSVSGAILGSVSSRLAGHAPCPVYVIPHEDQADSADASAAAEGGPVVVGVDGSPSSDGALRLAFDLAAAYHTGLRVVSAYQVPAIGVPLEASMVTEYQQAGEEQAKKIIDDSLGRVQTDGDQGTAVESVVGEGRPADVITAASKEAVITVVGSRGHGALARLLLGSVSRTVLQEATRPVAVVHVETSK